MKNSRVELNFGELCAFFQLPLKIDNILIELLI